MWIGSVQIFEQDPFSSAYPRSVESEHRHPGTLSGFYLALQRLGGLLLTFPSIWTFQRLLWSQPPELALLHSASLPLDNLSLWVEAHEFGSGLESRSAGNFAALSFLHTVKDRSISLQPPSARQSSYETFTVLLYGSFHWSLSEHQQSFNCLKSETWHHLLDVWSLKRILAEQFSLYPCICLYFILI